MSSPNSLNYQRKYEYNRYHSDITHHFLKRYQSRANNYFGEDKHKAIDLLKCSPSFFLKWIMFCLSDTHQSRTPLSKIELGHIIPVTFFKDKDKDDLSLWHWTNVFPMLESQNLEQKMIEFLY